MEKDFRIGLIAGAVFVIGALIWVATRPGQSPQARLGDPNSRSSNLVSPNPPAVPTVPSPQTPEPHQTLPPGVIPAELAQPSTPTVASLEPTGSTAPPEEASQPNAPDLTIYEQAEPIQTTKFHIVRRNESLSSISKLYYNTPNRWQKILDANRGTIRDPNRISPGTKLIIPD